MLSKSLTYIALGAMSAHIGFAVASSAELAKLDLLVSQQLQVERATSALQLEAQQTLADNKRLIALYQQEHKALSKALARQQQQQDEVAEKRTELLAAQEEQEQRTQAYEQQLAQGSDFLLGIWPQLPPPISKANHAQWLKLQDNKLGLSERFAAMIDLLTKLEEFDASINLHQGQLMHQGEQWHGEQLFIGLSQAYYRLPNGEGAGIGGVVDGTWAWQSKPEAQAEINRAFEIYQGKQTVEFVTLPLTSVEVQP